MYFAFFSPLQAAGIWKWCFDLLTASEYKKAEWGLPVGRDQFKSGMYGLGSRCLPVKRCMMILF